MKKEEEERNRKIQEAANYSYDNSSYDSRSNSSYSGGGGSLDRSF
ncbi:hypothetical protein [Solibacillus palustris]|nr:hypothetical protein [Solibacillus sp. MA9]